jgi:membrane-bound metal-dependent hydrolase YbcI (DUF457 family)
MPLAVTHVLLTIILVDLYRDYVTKNKKYFTLHTVLIAGIAGLLPDIDVPIRMIYSLFNTQVPVLLQHGMLTHTPLFALVFLIPALILWKQEKHKVSMMFFVITFGAMFHIFLDWFIGGGAYEGIMWFFPFSTTTFKLHILRNLGITDWPMALDAVILLGWLWHEEVKHKIKDFI